MSVTMQTLMELERERLSQVEALSDEGFNFDLQEVHIRSWATKTWNALFNDGFQLSPVGSFLLVKDIPQEEGVSAGGIFLPAARTDQELTRAVVVAVPARGIPLKSKTGELRGYRPSVAQVGDIVLYEKFRGVEISSKGIVHVLVEEDSIVGTLEAE